MLARLLQGMPELLGAVHHRGRQAQADLAMIRARAAGGLLTGALGAYRAPRVPA